MAECVSCGKKIPPGKFFCGDCYVKMKGRWSPQGKAASPTPPTDLPGAGQAVPPADTGPAAAGRPEADAGPQGGMKRPSGALTPPAEKKVISMKPGVEKAGRDKDRTAPRRFTVTITFSERTYEALGRMKNRLKVKKPKEAAPAVEGEVDSSPAAKTRKAGRKTGPYGRPGLKAVQDASKAKAKGKEGYLMRWVGYRQRAWDAGDYVAGLMATVAMIMTIVLSFLNWVRVEWAAEGDVTVQVVGIRGLDIGTITYFIIATAGLAWIYMFVTYLLKRPLLKVDFGVVFLVAGAVELILTFIALSLGDHIYRVAVGRLHGAGMSIPATVANAARQTLWPAYLMVLMGLLLSLAGLVRASERRESAVEQEEGV